jgi:hypothetical protein
VFRVNQRIADLKHVLHLNGSRDDLRVPNIGADLPLGSRAHP